MKKGLFSVFDTKSQVFSNPFASIREEAAERDFLNACNDPESVLFKNPSDYALYYLAELDDNTGGIFPIIPIALICYGR